MLCCRAEFLTTGTIEPAHKHLFAAMVGESVPRATASLLVVAVPTNAMPLKNEAPGHAAHRLNDSPKVRLEQRRNVIGTALRTAGLHAAGPSATKSQNAAFRQGRTVTGARRDFSTLTFLHPLASSTWTGDDTTEGFAPRDEQAPRAVMVNAQMQCIATMALDQAFTGARPRTAAFDDVCRPMRFH